jgi:hypothetical protein
VCAALRTLFAQKPFEPDANVNGYCYLIAFPGLENYAAKALGPYPDGLAVEKTYKKFNPGKVLSDDYRVVEGGAYYHLVKRADPWGDRQLGDHLHLDPILTTDLQRWAFRRPYKIGATGEMRKTVEDVTTLLASIPVANELKGRASNVTNAFRAEVHCPRPRVSLPVPHAHRRLDVDEDHARSHTVTRKMNTVSAMEAAKTLLSGMESLGSNEERLAVAMETFPDGIPTAIAPSNPVYARLMSLLGPLRYTPRMEAHPAAGTIRRAAMNHAITTLCGAVVGLVSPSKAEVHAFPMGVVWEYEDGSDVTRRSKHCTICAAPVCFVLDQAKRANRYYKGNSLDRAAGLFKYFEVSSLLLVNIEPNINASRLTELMVTSGAYHALSLATVDWRALLGRKVVDNLIGMTTEESFGEMVSSFHDGGDYVQSRSNVVQMFAPTFAKGHALRRTIIFGDGATQYFELSLVRGGWATRCVPQHEKYYFIRLVLPDMTRPAVLVERQGFDRVLATYRTQAIKGKDIARITLRQSVVTYSISGTQVTPRLSISATEAEALAVWIEVYSEVQDSLAAKHADTLRPSTITSGFKSTVFNMVTDSLTKSVPGSMALGSYSSVEALLRAYRSTVGEFTLDQLSEATLHEHFGTKIEPMSIQNMVISSWQSLFSWVRTPSKWMELIEKCYRDAWCVAFGWVDAVVVTCVVGGVCSLQAIRVVMDCAVAWLRITGRVDALNQVQRFMDQLDWHINKVNHAWVAVQNAQHLDFQAAAIDIVETFFNTFAYDPAADMQRVREMTQLTAEQVEELELNASLPYSDFLSEVKLFLAKFNTHARRCAMAVSLLSAFKTDCRKVSPERKSKMLHLLKEEANAVPTEVHKEVLAFALSGSYTSEPIPLRPINQTDVREAFHLAEGLTMNTADGPVRLRRLQKVGDAYDFSPIHDLMAVQHGEAINMENIRGPNYLSPDERGAALQERLIAAVEERRLGGSFVPQQAMLPWLHAQLAMDGQLDFVADILRRRESLFSGHQARNWLAHITGLAMGGKSKGVRSWINSNDIVIVPTRQLKEEWQENLGKLDPVRRATVVTQHEALDEKWAARYVFIDECYAFDPEHLQALANRHHRSRGVITIGDKRQIANVFSTTGNRLLLGECPCVMITPTTFVGWDAAAVYLNTTNTDVYVEHLFCGSDNPESLRYTLASDDTLLPGAGDKAIQGTQNAKEMMQQRGVQCNTVHECQGSRTEHTVVHGIGRCLSGDLQWLGSADQAAHCGVLLTRARQHTVFVVEGLENLRPFRWFDNPVINGPLPTTVIYGGTAWDMIEPRTESESVWRHVYEAPIADSYLEEQPLTDPITIGTVFNTEGDAISSSEIRTNVELVNGCNFSDLGIANSDKFDNYTIQPRDVPGADQVQALTRAVADVKPVPADYQDAETIVQLIFEEVLDKKTFFAHLNNSRRAALSRQTRQQVIDGCYANVETAASTLSFAFLKPEFAKKPSVLQDGPSELKAQGVVSASDMQQALFADVCDALTHAWARSMRRGKLSPVGFREEEVEDFLSTFDSSYELDIEKQDSSHRPVHILVAGIFLEMASEKLGLKAVAQEIRFERRVRMMGSPFKFLLNKALASGDPWTLIINKIMAVSSLISVADLLDVRMCQSGDDVTLDREPRWRSDGLRSQRMANKGLVWKMEKRSQARDGVTFISRAVLPNRNVVYKALRTILKYAVRQRNSIMHAGIAADALRVQRLASRHGLQAYAEARAQVWGGDPVVIFDMWTRALAIARTPFQSLPLELKKDEPRQYSIRERNGGCFGFALASCVCSNVQAINALAMYSQPVGLGTAIKACRDNNVNFVVMNELFANRSRKRLQDEMDRKHFSRSFVVLYEDHAVAVVPNTLTIHSGFGKRTITWSSSQSKDVEITDFE